MLSHGLLPGGYEEFAAERESPGDRPETLRSSDLGTDYFQLHPMPSITTCEGLRKMPPKFFPERWFTAGWKLQQGDAQVLDIAN